MILQDFNQNVTTKTNDLSTYLLQKVEHDRLVEDYKLFMQKENIDIKEEQRAFLSRYTKNTQIAYTKAFRMANLWLEKPSCFWTAAEVDEYIYTLSKTKRKETIRQYLRAHRLFFEFVKRRNTLNLQNPFKEVRYTSDIDPKDTVIPTHEEVEIMIARTNIQKTKLSIALMYYNGLRCDGVHNIEINGDSFTTLSKGKKMHGKLHPVCVELARGLDSKPFAKRSPSIISLSIYDICEDLYKHGKIATKYSAHDLRHASAVRAWFKTKDLHVVANVLGHSSLSQVDTYLKSLFAPKKGSRELTVVV